MNKLKSMAIPLTALLIGIATLTTIGQTLQMVTPSCAQLATCNTYTTTVDEFCGNVTLHAEYGLAAESTVTVANSDMFNGGLKFTAVIMKYPGGGADYSTYWKLKVGGVIVPSISSPNINNGTPYSFQVVFDPPFASPGLNAANYQAVLRITSSNGEYCYPDDFGLPGGTDDPIMDIDVELNGNVDKTNINYVLVFDKSGSMSSLASSSGTKTRMELLRTAGQYFIDLLSIRGNQNDKIGFVRFSDAAASFYDPNLVVATSTNLASIKTAIGTSVDLNPGGMTAIGQGLEAGDALFTNGQKNAMILFTDGEENVGPRGISSLYPPTIINNSSTISTIGMSGLVGTGFQLSLENYAVTHAGVYYHVEDGISTAGLPADLQKKYLEIFSHITGLQGSSDPFFQVPLGNQARLVSSTLISSSDKSVIFSVFDNPDYRRYYDVEIRSPKGEVMITGTLPSGLKSTVITGTDYFIYGVDFYDATDKSFYVGQWDLILRPKVETKGPTVVPIGFASTVHSNLTMEFDLGANDRYPGNELRFALDFKERQATLSRVKEILVQITSPSGAVTKVVPTKDSFGKWVAQYPHTYEAGTYSVLVRATVWNDKDELSVREQTKHIVFSPPVTQVSKDGPCIECNIKITLWVVVIALLIFILVRFWKR